MPFFRSTLLLILSISAASAWSQDYENKDTPSENQFSIGAATIATPEFEGASKHRFRALPVIEYNTKNIFISSQRGVGYKAINNPTLSMGPLTKYRWGRDEDDSDLLKGMGDVKGGVELGGFLDWNIAKPVNVRLEVLQGLGTAKGYTADLSVNYRKKLNEALHLTVGASTQYSNAKYNQEYFGVTHQQSFQSGYETYAPGSGIKHIALKSALSYGVSKDIRLSVFGEYKRLTGPAADSPLVKKGSANQIMTGVALTWSL